MNDGPIVMYLGGFARVGGIETFARDLLVAIADAHPQRELVIWGRPRRPHKLLQDIAESGTRISGTFWRWGCLWNVPDYVLAAQRWSTVRRASAVIFKRPPPLFILKLLRRIRRRDGRRAPFILVTPYRPGEYWNPRPQPGEMESFDVITVQSEDGRRDLQRLGYAGRIENIPYLPPRSQNPAPFPNVAPSLIRIGFLGRLVAQKNLGYLLDVYRALLAMGDNRYQLHLFGEGSERSELQRRMDDEKLPGITFHGETPRDQVAAAIDSCHLFLNTSTSEGQCLAALEILSRGRPMVATPVGALPEVFCDDALGGLAPLDDAEAFAGKVREIAGFVRQHRISPTSVIAAFSRRYDRDLILARYLSLLADTSLPGEVG
jgi:glycosyltransferase involved in cell wall biosynthesis